MARKSSLERKVCPEDGTQSLEQDESLSTREDIPGQHCIEVTEPYKVIMRDCTILDKEVDRSQEALEDLNGNASVHGPDEIAAVGNSGRNCPNEDIPAPSTSSGNAEVGVFEVVIVQSDGNIMTTDQLDTGVSKSCRLENDSILRCASTFSTDSLAECCRICQQHNEEPLLDLGCHCRGELAKAHRTCIQQWFGNKGTNKCEICQHVAENVPAPPAQSVPHFWVWRLGINRSGSFLQRRNGARFHPLWAALLILIAGLLFDVLISIFLGASALPVNIIIGVLVVLGIGTAARLVVECWHERGLRRNIRRMETNLAHLQGDGMMGIHGNVLQGQSNFVIQPTSVPSHP